MHSFYLLHLLLTLLAFSSFTTASPYRSLIREELKVAMEAEKAYELHLAKNGQLLPTFSFMAPCLSCCIHVVDSMLVADAVVGGQVCQMIWRKRMRLRLGF